MKLRKTLLMTAIAAAVLSSATGAYAAGKGWTEKDGIAGYVGSDGKAAKGRVKIDGNVYRFDGKGRQLTGWRKNGKSYEYFRMVAGKGGYLIRNRTIDGVKLDGNGKAVLKKGTVSEFRIETLAAYSEIADKIRFSNSAADLKTVKGKAYACVKYMLKRNLRYRDVPLSVLSCERDALSWATQAYQSDFVTDCRGAAASFAYMMKSLGVKDVTLRYVGLKNGNRFLHAYAQIGSSYYDPLYACYEGRKSLPQAKAYLPLNSASAKSLGYVKSVYKHQVS